MDYHAFIDELMKIAEDLSSQSTPPEVGQGSFSWKTPAAVAAGGLLGLGAFAAAKKGLRTHMLAKAKGFGRGGARHVEEKVIAKGPPQEIVDQAAEIVKAIRERGLDPSKIRVGIAGTGGTGKSTLGREVSRQLQMGMKEMDHVVPTHLAKGRDWSKVTDDMLPYGHVFEQSHLHTSLDPNKFDLLVHMEKPIDQIKKQIYNRGRGAYQMDVYDYDRFQKGVRSAFDSAGGQVSSVGGGTRIQFKPQEGFKQIENLQQQVQARGIDPSKLDRQALSVAAGSGKVPLLPGNYAYVKGKTIGQAAGAIGAGGVGGGLLMHGLSNTSPITPD